MASNGAIVLAPEDFARIQGEMLHYKEQWMEAQSKEKRYIQDIDNMRKHCDSMERELKKCQNIITRGKERKDGMLLLSLEIESTRTEHNDHISALRNKISDLEGQNRFLTRQLEGEQLSSVGVKMEFEELKHKYEEDMKDARARLEIKQSLHVSTPTASISLDSLSALHTSLLQSASDILSNPDQTDVMAYLSQCQDLRTTLVNSFAKQTKARVSEDNPFGDESFAEEDDEEEEQQDMDQKVSQVYQQISSSISHLFSRCIPDLQHSISNAFEEQKNTISSASFSSPSASSAPNGVDENLLIDEKRRNQILNEKLSELELLYKQTKERVEQLQNVEEMNAQLEEQVTDLENNNSVLESEKEAIRQKLHSVEEDSKSKLKQFEGRISQLKEEMSLLKSQSNEAILKRSELESLLWKTERDLEETKKTLVEKVSHLNDMEQKVAANSVSREALVNRLRELELLPAQIVELNQRIETLEQEVMTKETQLQNSLVSTQSLNQREAEWNSKCNALTEEVNAARIVHTSHLHQIQEFRDENYRLSERMLHLQDKIHSLEMGASQQEKSKEDAINAERLNLARLKSERDLKIDDLTEERDGVLKKLKSLEATNQQQSTDIVKLSSDNLLLEHIVKNLERELSAEKKIGEEIRSENALFTEEKQRLIAAKELLETQVGDLRMELKATEKKSSNLIKELKTQLAKHTPSVVSVDPPTPPREPQPYKQALSNSDDLLSSHMQESSPISSVPSSFSLIIPSPASSNYSNNSMTSDMESLIHENNVLAKRVGDLQATKWKSDERVQFLEGNIGLLQEQLERKNKVLQFYLAREKSGRLSVSVETPEQQARAVMAAAASSPSPPMASSQSKAGGFLSSLFTKTSNSAPSSASASSSGFSFSPFGSSNDSSSSAPSATAPVAASLEVQEKMQLVLEECIVKNMQLQSDVATLGETIASLSDANKALKGEVDALKAVNRSSEEPRSE